MTKRRSKSPLEPPSKQKRHRFGKGRGQLAATFLALAIVFGGLGALYTTHGGRQIARPLNSHGLRVTGRGRADASHVLPAAMFSDPRVQNAYRRAALVPVTLNQLYCWCGCIERGMRSNLECFESEHASGCDICMAGAETAWDMRQKGITDPARIQQVLDARFAPQAE